MILPPATVRNEALWHKHRRQVRVLAQRIIDGKVGVIDGSRQMMKFQVRLHARDDDEFRTFVGVDSESHHLPIGDVRKHWAPDALKKKDIEIRDLEQFYRPAVVAAATRILAKYE